MWKTMWGREERDMWGDAAKVTGLLLKTTTKSRKCARAEIQGAERSSHAKWWKTKKDTLWISPVALESEADMILLPAPPSPHSSTPEPSSHQPVVTVEEKWERGAPPKCSAASTVISYTKLMPWLQHWCVCVWVAFIQTSWQGRTLTCITLLFF